jgi:nucleotide-binding universal stress UspA family protein
VSRILVATDLSEAADEAVRQAGRWARELQARRAVCHVIAGELRSDPLFPQLNTQAAIDAVELKRRVMDELAARTGELAGVGADEVLIEEGSPHEVLSALAEQGDTALLVVGGHGEGHGLRHAILGSVADKVMRRAPCPILVARPSPSTGRVLAATDLDDPARPALVAAAGVVRRRGGELVVMHSIDVVSTLRPGGDGPIGVPEDTMVELEAEAEAEIARALDGLGVAARTVIAHGPAASTILHEATVLEAELIVLGSHGRGRLGRLVLGHVAEEVAHKATCSVLVVPLGRTEKSEAAA